MSPSSPLPLSVLDLVPVPLGMDAAGGVREALRLAQEAEALGYARYWVAEHHNMGALASSVPLAILAAASQVTSSIRLGSGGVMLPNHAPLSVAEGYRLLGALAPGRVDLGLGRAPGTDGRTARALRGQGMLMDEPFEHQLADLIAYGTGDFPAGHPFAGTVAAPAGEELFPPLWILSSSGHGARVAAQVGAGLAFAWHINPDTALARHAADVYRAAFEPSAAFPAPRVIVAASVVTASTAAEAEEQSLPLGLMFLRLTRGERAPFPTVEEAKAYPYTPQERAVADGMRRRAVIGDPDTVAGKLLALAQATAADELILSVNVPDPARRRQALALIMDAVRRAEGREVVAAD
ncbi:luciferase family oxidoreductase group 1 [Deinococcus metalli]|uniref:Luciferase family oxidoreductase group 1 n=1 Tax=Deinococcus metalli TaxID=1141878 RepID=A0A7W8KKH9_9DEIO|nr:LLM class flavin-dependent oxidoreductase [Deinococcus metalli]MBB5378209.1 luciferase family oxidoreductase group 1 [Deinococcus metalli]GHF56843.1 N5,N10-methylene tetrahydromethanopterin reductase [Deinococcus metalli]